MIDLFGLFKAPAFGDEIGYNSDYGGPGSWNSAETPYLSTNLSPNPFSIQNHLMINMSGNVFGDGWEMCDGVEQRTLSFFDLIGFSYNLYIGQIPSSKDLVSEINLGLGKHIGLGHFFGKPDSLGNMEIGGLVLHFGVGLGSPISISGTFPEGIDPVRGKYARE